MLDRTFAEHEASPDLEQRKQAIRRRIYATQYVTLANKYFGFGMDSDARRCYLRAIRSRPDYVLGPAVLRRLAATWVGRAVYERSKSIVKRGVAERPAGDSQ